MKQELKYDYLKRQFNLPDDCRIEKTGNYYKIVNMDHCLQSFKGILPLHRYILFEYLGRPSHSLCHWCGYSLPWKSSLTNTGPSVVHVDHFDENTENNNPENLKPSCYWCNINRKWAREYPEFWSNWRKWMRDVPPAYRPNLISIAEDYGIYPNIER